MKYFYTLVLVAFLASCTSGQAPIEPKTVENKTVNEVNTVVDELDDVMDDLQNDVEEMAESKIVKLDAKYTNPKTDVDMMISYSLDENAKIKTIEVTATTYDVTEFNKAVQTLVGKTIDEAKEANIAGGSLTTNAFKDALK